MTNRVEIRLAVPGDEDAIADVLFEAFSQFRSDYTPVAFSVVTPPAEDIAERFEEGAMWVAEIGGKILGTVSVLPEPEWLYIRSVAVLPAAQGKGIARLMMNAVEKYASENGFDRLFLYTTYFSTGAIELYEKLGFKRGRDTTAEEWYGTPGLAMDKILERKTKQNVVGS
ncbi:GNAT family N-acetyltransferase [soil metagenome]